jgi:curved DNA-binding protein
MDYYNILGVAKNATADEVKQAYRKLAAKHHPDRGGDTASFQKIQEAYATLGDEQKRAEYDNPQAQFAFNSTNMDDLFGAMFGGGRGPFGFGGVNQRMRKNRNINVRVQMTLIEVLTGKDFVGSIKLPSGREQMLQLKIPKGVKQGDSIRFQGMGDDSIPNMPRGDLILIIEEEPHPIFHRQDANLIMNQTISVFDAMTGSKINIITLENSTLEINVPPGIGQGTTLSCNGYGLPRNTQTNDRGNILIRINVAIPAITDDRDIQVINELKKKYGY